MGQKCSCICNKENDNTYSFFPESSSTTNNNNLQPGEVKSFNISPNKTNEKESNLKENDYEFQRLDNTPYSSRRKLDANTNAYLDKNINQVIKIQSIIYRFLVVRRLKKNKSQLMAKVGEDKESIIQSTLTEFSKSILDTLKDNPFNKNRWNSKEYWGLLNKNQQEEMSKVMMLFNSDGKINQKGNQKQLMTDMLLKDNTLYSGNLNINQERHGYGKLWTSNGNIYEGFWLNDSFTGYGRIVLSDGNAIEGFFNKFNINFPGEKWSMPSIYYKGEFLNNLKEGKGFESGKDYQYAGDFQQDKKQGTGKITYTNTNEEYSGTFFNNSLTGKGVYTWSNGDTYTGDFVNGKMHGFGEYRWPEGGKYVGEYINNIKEGKGTFYWTNGRVYDGEFSNGKPHGVGVITQGDKSYNVEFDDGKLVKKMKI